MKAELELLNVQVGHVHGAGHGVEGAGLLMAKGERAGRGIEPFPEPLMTFKVIFECFIHTLPRN